jgi:hypothetical protein
MLDSPCQGSKTGLTPPISTSVPGTPQLGYASLVFAAGGFIPAALAPFVLASNIPAFSVLALKVHGFLDGERLTGR